MVWCSSLPGVMSLVLTTIARIDEVRSMASVVRDIARDSVMSAAIFKLFTLAVFTFGPFCLEMM